MRGIYGKNGFTVRINETEERPLGINDVRLRVKACGVCGTDVHFLRNAEDLTPLGHEISAEVLKTGMGVNDLKVGDRVVVEDVSFCGVCALCKNGQMHLCKSGPTLEGQSGMGDYLVVDRRMVVPFDGLTDIEACMTEPLAVALNAFLMSGLRADETVVTYGMGAIGLLCAAVSKYYGLKKVIVVGNHNITANDQYRKSIALKNGADAVLFSDESDLNQKIEQLCGGKADGVIISSPPKTIPAALEVLKHGGTAVPLGIDLGGGQHIQLDINALIFNKHVIKPMLAEPALRFPMSIALLKDHIINVSDFITHTFGFDTAEAVLKQFKVKKERILKAVFINE